MAFRSKQPSDADDPWPKRAPSDPANQGDTFPGPLTGFKIPVRPEPKPRSLKRTIAGLLMAIVATFLTLIALTSETTRQAFINDWYTFFGWLLGTIIIVGVPWTITYFLLRAPRLRRERKASKAAKS